MANYNSITIIGNCTRDPEQETTKSGISFAKVGVAVNKKVGSEDRTTFFNVKIWGKTSEVAVKYLKKGSNVLFSGEMEQNRYEKNGEQKEIWILNAYNMQLLSKPEQSRKSENTSYENDEVPF